MLSKILLLACLLVVVLSEGTIDFSYSSCQPGAYVKEKKVDVRYTYTLSNNQWTQFPDMFISFELDEPQWVFIKYHIASYLTCSCVFYTQLVLDGNNDHLFLLYQDSAYRNMNIAANEVYLEKGTHTAQVKYYTNGGRTILSNWGYPAIFLVRYKSKTP